MTFLHAMAIAVQEAEYVGTPDTIDIAGDALVRSLHEPPRRLGIVLRHGLADMVKVAQDSLRYWIPLRGHGGAKLGRPGLPGDRGHIARIALGPRRTPEQQHGAGSAKDEC